MMTQTDAARIFDSRAIRRHRDRAAPIFADHAFLHEHVADGLLDRLADVTRQFDRVVEIGAQGGTLARRLTGTRGIRDYTAVEPAARPAAALRHIPGVRVVRAEEELPPLADNAADLILSLLALQGANDLPGALIQINRALRPDGLFLGAMLGGDSLAELREIMLAAEIEVSGGASPRVAPMVSLRDLGALMQRAGFALPVIDHDRVTVTYETPLKLIADLRGMGLTLATFTRNRAIPPRAFWPTVDALYRDRYGGADGRVPATFEILWALGWAPAEGQPRPLRPGSAKQSLAQALGTEERSAGEKAGRG